MNKATEEALLHDGAKVSSAQEAEQVVKAGAPVVAAGSDAPKAVPKTARKEAPTATPNKTVKEIPREAPPKKAAAKSLIGSVKLKQSPKVELAPEQEQAVKEGVIAPIQPINPIQLPIPP